MKTAFSVQEQLDEVERAISALRTSSPRSIGVLKFIATDLRHRLNGQRDGVVLINLRRKIERALAAKTRQEGMGFPVGVLADLGKETLAGWPTIDRSLNLMDGRTPELTNEDWNG